MTSSFLRMEKYFCHPELLRYAHTRTRLGFPNGYFSIWRIMFSNWRLSGIFRAMLKQPRQRRSRKAPTPDWVAERIRVRRLALGLTLGQLSERAGLRSPSFVFHLERGDKAPSQATAVALARALGDDVDLYRAWAKALNRADLATALA